MSGLTAAQWRRFVGSRKRYVQALADQPGAPAEVRMLALMVSGEIESIFEIEARTYGTDRAVLFAKVFERLQAEDRGEIDPPKFLGPDDPRPDPRRKPEEKARGESPRRKPEEKARGESPRRENERKKSEA